MAGELKPRSEVWVCVCIRKVGRQAGHPKREPQASQVGSGDSWKLSFPRALCHPGPCGLWMSPWSPTELVVTTDVSRCVSEILKCPNPEPPRACMGPAGTRRGILVEEACSNHLERHHFVRRRIGKQDSEDRMRRALPRTLSLHCSRENNELEPHTTSQLHPAWSPFACF